MSKYPVPFGGIMCTSGRFFPESKREGRAGKCVALLRKKMGGGKLLSFPPEGGEISFPPNQGYIREPPCYRLLLIHDISQRVKSCPCQLQFVDHDIQYEGKNRESWQEVVHNNAVILHSSRSVCRSVRFSGTFSMQISLVTSGVISIPAPIALMTRGNVP